MIRYDIKKYIETYHNNLITEPSSSFFVPLFHGTDNAIIKMTSAERSILKDACLTLIPKLYSLYINNNLLQHPEIKKIEHYKEVLPAFTRANGLVNNSPIYNYNHTYFTNGLDRALDYAQKSKVFGELGFTTYTLYIALTEMNIPIPLLSKKEEAALNIILKATKSNPKPVVLMFTDLDKSLLLYEDGRNLGDFLINTLVENYYEDNGSGMTLSLRYMGSVDFSKGIIVDITKVPIHTSRTY